MRRSPMGRRAPVARQSPSRARHGWPLASGAMAEVASDAMAHTKQSRCHARVAVCQPVRDRQCELSMRDGSHRISVTGSAKRGPWEQFVRDRQRPSRASRTMTPLGGGTIGRIVSDRNWAGRASAMSSAAPPSACPARQAYRPRRSAAAVRRRIERRRHVGERFDAVAVEELGQREAERQRRAVVAAFPAGSAKREADGAPSDVPVTIE